MPGSEHIFSPIKVGVPPTAGSSGEVTAGNIYAPDGSPQSILAVRDPARIFSIALLGGLADAGLRPVALDSIASDRKPPNGIDFVLSSELVQFEVTKRFAAEQTVHGQYFTMAAVVKAKFELANRDGRVIYSGQLTGLENEPPLPISGEIFLPLETEPVESISVALSRAIGSLMLEPGFRSVLH